MQAPNVHTVNERDLIEYIHRLPQMQATGLIQGIGDDCAVLEKDGEQVWLVTLDSLVESIHFDCSWHPPELLGHKAIAVNVSDIAAMGGRPLFILLSLGLPAGFDQDWLHRFMQGLTQACNRSGCCLVGGDTVCSPQGISLSITVIGEMEKTAVLYRHTAQIGDTVWVSGPLGRAAAGLAWLQSAQQHQEQACPKDWQALVQAHLAPEARLDLARFLAKTGRVHAMMDLSDGLSTDLAHLCQRSQLGAIIHAEQLPGQQDLAALARLLHQDPLTWMLSGGEDYELLFTTAVDEGPELLQLAAQQGYTLYPIGSLVAGEGVHLRRQQADGSLIQEALSFQGFDHFATR